MLLNSQGTAGSLVVGGGSRVGVGILVGSLGRHPAGAARSILAGAEAARPPLVAGGPPLSAAVVAADHTRLDTSKGSDSTHSTPYNTGCNRYRSPHSRKKSRCPS